MQRSSVSYKTERPQFSSFAFSISNTFLIRELSFLSLGWTSFFMYTLLSCSLSFSFFGFLQHGFSLCSIAQSDFDWTWFFWIGRGGFPEAYQERNSFSVVAASIAASCSHRWCAYRRRSAWDLLAGYRRSGSYLGLQLAYFLCSFHCCMTAFFGYSTSSRRATLSLLRIFSFISTLVLKEVKSLQTPHQFRKTDHNGVRRSVVQHQV